MGYPQGWRTGADSVCDALVADAYMNGHDRLDAILPSCKEPRGAPRLGRGLGQTARRGVTRRAMTVRERSDLSGELGEKIRGRNHGNHMGSAYRFVMLLIPGDQIFSVSARGYFQKRHITGIRQLKIEGVRSNSDTMQAYVVDQCIHDAGG